MPYERLIARAQIRPPAEAMRAEMDDKFLEDLAASIRAVGLLFPLVVEPAGEKDAAKKARAGAGALDKFLDDGGEVEIIDGHQRFVASEHVPLEMLRCSVLVDDTISKHAVMLHANIFRKDVTPAEEGWQFVELATKHSWSMDELTRRFGVSENYINDRCELVQKDTQVALAVHKGQLNLAQAKQLLRVQEPSFRLYLLDQAVTHGANAHTLAVMRQNKAAEAAAAQGALLPHTADHSPAPDPAAPHICIWCGGSDDPENIRTIDVHWYHQRDLEAVIDKVAIKHVLRGSS